MIRNIFKKIFRISLLIVIAKGISLLKEVVVADRIGVSKELDSFIVANIIASLTILFVHRPLSDALIPEFSKLDINDIKKQNDYFSSIFWIGGVISIFIITLLIIFRSYYLQFLVKDSNSTILIIRFLFYLTPFIFFSYISWLFIGVLNAKKKTWVAAIEPLFASFLTIVFLFFQIGKSGAYSLILGLNFGAFLLAFLAVSSAYKTGVRLQFKFRITSKIKITLNQYLPFAFSMILSSMNTVVDTFMAAKIGIEGVSSLSYANKVYSMFVFLPITLLNIIYFPYISRLIGNQLFEKMYNEIKLGSLFIGFFLLIVSMITVLNAVFIVELIFERGSFLKNDTQVVSSIFAFYCIGLTFHILSIKGLRIISALQQNKYLALFSIMGVLLNIIFNILFTKYFGIRGIALSTSFVYFIIFIFIVFLFFRKKSFFINKVNA